MAKLQKSLNDHIEGKLISEASYDIITELFKNASDELILGRIRRKL